jgi:hypothetical protein
MPAQHLPTERRMLTILPEGCSRCRYAKPKFAAPDFISLPRASRLPFHSVRGE